MRPGNCSGSYSEPPRARAIALRSSSCPREVDATTFSIRNLAMGTSAAGTPRTGAVGGTRTQVGRLEADKTRQIGFVSERARGFAYRSGGRTSQGDHAAIEDGHQPPLLLSGKMRARTAEEIPHFLADVFDRNQVAGTVPAQFQEEPLVAEEEEATDERVRINEQLHDTASSRHPS